MSSTRASASRRTVLLTRRCNNACIFCGQSSEPSEHEQLGAALDAVREATDALTFVGGEPLLDDALETWSREAKSRGFRAIGVQTNGRLLAREGRAEKLARAGVTDVHVSLHGAEAAVHDYHTGVVGSFAQTLAGIAAARVAGLTVVTTTVLTRSSYRALADLPRLLLARGVSAMHIAVPWARGRAEASFDRVVPRLGMALPFALHAIDGARRIGLPAFISGAPLCMLGPLAARALPDDAPRAYTAECERCGVRARCPGVEARYLERFDGDELRARDEAPAPATEAIASMFVGLGERAPVTSGSVHDAPRAARRRLPVLSRPVPATQEVKRADARTGEALREIFPALFDAEEGG